MTIPVGLVACAAENLDFFLQDRGFGPLTFLCLCFFGAAVVDDSAFSRDSNTNFSYLVGCTFSAPIYRNVIVHYTRNVHYLFSLIM